MLGDAGLDVVGQSADATGLLEQVRTTTPDVAIVDIKMPPTHTDEGLVAAQRIRSDHPGVGVLVLSQYIEPSYAMPLPAPRDIWNRHLVGVAEWILTLQ